MKKLKKALQKISTRLAKKAPLTKKKSTPVKAVAKSPAKSSAAKKAAPAASAKKKVVAKTAAPKKAASADRSTDKSADKKKLLGSGSSSKIAAPAKKVESAKGKKLPAVVASKKANDKAVESKSEKSDKNANQPTTKIRKADGTSTSSSSASQSNGQTKSKAAGKADQKADLDAGEVADERVEAKTAKAKKSDEPKAVAKAAEQEVAGDDGYDEEAEVFLTDADGRRYCRVKECDQVSNVDGYCRFHYLLYWKKIQVRKKILTEGKLERYIEELTARYPDKYLEMLRKDLRTEKDFTAAITELELDETAGDSEYEDEAQAYLDEVRGVSGDSGSTRDDDGDF